MRKQDYKIAMGNRLRNYRTSAHITQEKMAELLDISLKHYSEVERGLKGLSVENLIKLSDISGISIDYLLKGGHNYETVPDTLIEIYETCPLEKRQRFIKLMQDLLSMILSSSEEEK